MKKIIIALVVLLVLAGIGVFLLVGNLDKIMKGALEGVGTELLGVPVTVGAVDIELKSGSGQITGLTVANPPGYQDANGFKMDMIRLGINLGSLGKQPIVIDELSIKSPVVELEVKEDGSSNLQTLLNNIKQNSAKADQKAAEEQPQSEGVDEGEPIRMRFNKLAITGVTVNAVVPGQEPQQLLIPDTLLENVGGETGITPAELGGLILGNIITQSLEAALEKKLTEKVEEAAKGLFDNLKNKLVPEKGK
jgi:hypothetical protein